jgi:hypothetical protein
MKIHQYQNYDEYLRIQKQHSAANSGGQWATEDEIKFLADYIGPLAKDSKILCHGVKSGNECGWFLLHSKPGSIDGTDLNPVSETVLQWDFNEVKPEWIDKFDIIYSNAFDHSCVPELTHRRWMSCLKQNGKLILEWTPAHNVGNEENPFGGDLHDYGEMIFRNGFLPKEILKYDLPAGNPIKEKHYMVVVHKPEFVILCDGGLGNRIGALLGGMVIAKQLDMEPVICWPANTWCGCEFKDIYKTDLKVLNMGIKELFETKKSHTFMVHANQIGSEFAESLPLAQAGIAVLNVSRANVVYFNDKVPDFIDNAAATKILDDLPINDDVFLLAANFCARNNINNSTMGVHIRKTDGGQRINETNLERYIVNHQGIRVFVCSDEKSVEDRFKALPGVITYPKSNYVEKLEEGDWNKETTDSEGRQFRCNVKRSRESIQEAFVDLLILSNTTIAHGSSSTFFQLAKRYEHRRRIAQCR